MVGSSQGTVHQPLHQGVGLATVLQGDRALDTLDRLGAEERAVVREERKRHQDELKGAYDTMLKMNPDRWMKHETIIQPKLNEWMDEGAKIMQTGRNPWKSVDALAWRKSVVELQGLANTSKQMQDAYIATRAKVASSEPGKFDDRTLIEHAKFFDMDPREVMEQGAIPPPLIQKRPFLNLQDTWSKTMSEINPRLNGQELNDQDRWKIVRETMTNSALSEDLMEATNSALAQMTPVEMQALNSRAKSLGKAPQEVLSYDFVKRYETQGTPFDFNAWLDAGVKQVGVPYKEWKGADNFAKKVDKAEFDRIARNRAEVMLADVEALQEYERELPRSPKDNDGEYKVKAANHLASRLKNLVATQEEAGVTARGADKKEFDTSRKLWLENIRSDNPKDYNEAMGYLFSAPGIFPGLTVQNAEIQESTAGYRELRLYLAGNLEYKDVKKMMEKNGIPVEENQVEARLNSTGIRIPITDQTENALMRLHDHAFEDTKLPYGGTYGSDKPDLKAIIGNDKPAPAAKPEKRKFGF